MTDRGDDYFAGFAERYRALLAEQEAAICAFYVLVDGAVLGWFNLYDLADGTATLGYRVGQHAAGREVATAAVRELCEVAAATTTHTNAASRRVLAKAGFVPAGPADRPSSAARRAPGTGSTCARSAAVDGFGPGPTG